MRLQAPGAILRYDYGVSIENRNQPTTKADLAALRDELIGAFRDSRTEVMKAFYSSTESYRQRLAQLEENQAALISRLGILEDRMAELERKLSFPNHPIQ